MPKGIVNEKQWNGIRACAEKAAKELADSITKLMEHPELMADTFECSKRTLQPNGPTITYYCIVCDEIGELLFRRAADAYNEALTRVLEIRRKVENA